MAVRVHTVEHTLVRFILWSDMSAIVLWYTVSFLVIEHLCISILQHTTGHHSILREQYCQFKSK